MKKAMNNYSVSCAPWRSEIQVAKEREEQIIRDKERESEWKKGDLIFKVTRLIAESDSIGEGHSYCPDYKKAWHDEDMKKRGDRAYINLALTIIHLVKKTKYKCKIKISKFS